MKDKEFVAWGIVGTVVGIGLLVVLVGPPGLVQDEALTVEEHKTPSGKSCYILKENNETIAFTCD